MEQNPAGAHFDRRNEASKALACKLKAYALRVWGISHVWQGSALNSLSRLSIRQHQHECDACAPMYASHFRLRAPASYFVWFFLEICLAGKDIDEANWQGVKEALQKGSKGQGDAVKPVPPSELRSFARALGLVSNSLLQSENDSSTTAANLLVRSARYEAA
eukprot:4859533-Pleurochrysis_carterae.AAC.3